MKKRSLKKAAFNRFESLESRLLFAAGDIDVALNDGHLITTAFKAGGSQINDVATLPDGGIVAVGSIQILKKGIVVGNEAAIAEYNFDGSLNTAFGSGGELIGGLGAMTTPSRVQVGTDDSIYILDASHSQIAKLTGSGAVDTTFGKSGLLAISGIFNVTSFTLDASNNILVAGYNHPVQSDEPTTTDGVLRRYTSSGAIDLTFHGGSDFVLAPVGKTNTQAQYRTMIFATPMVDSSGNILISASDALHADHNSGTIDVTNEYVYRLTSAGKIDRTFGSSGNVKLADGTILISATLAGVMSNGNIVVDSNSHLTQYKSNGALNTSYGNNGVSSVDVTFAGRIGNGKAITIADDGSALAITTSGSNGVNFSIKHMLSNGALDTDFGNNGVISPTALGASFADGLTLAPDGTVVIGGQVGELSPSGKVDTRTFALARLYTGKGPAIQLVPRTLKTKSRYLSMTVLIRDNEGVNTGTLDNNDLKLFDADGSTRKIRLLHQTDVRGDGRYIQATYRIVAPNNQKTWLASDDAIYEVRLQKQQITDDNSNAAEAQILGTLRVKI